MNNALDLRQISRREFLKLSSAALLSLLASSRTSYAYADSVRRNGNNQNLARILYEGTELLTEPSFESKVIQTFSKDTYLPITKTTVGSGEPAYNLIWYELDGKGYVHSGNIQPVQNVTNQPAASIPASGLLAEVTVPFTDTVWNPDTNRNSPYRLYYSTTHWVVDILKDNNGTFWYEILEDYYQFHYYAKAAHLRIIPSQEFTTLSPSVPEADKRLEVRLNEQVVVAYEGDVQVQLLKCSAGILAADGYMTPTGNFHTDYKRPSRHMINGNQNQMNTFDLPGVPWISYLDENGISFHGTYWHNDFGHPHSHGCINLPSESAKWIYRWTLPNVPFEEQKSNNKGGTFVRVS